jgi:hypothetical protein
MFTPSLTKARIAAPRVLASSGVAVPHTGNTNETALLTLSIPAGSMGANGWIQISSTWGFAGANNNRTPRIRLGGIGGTAFMAVAHASTILSFSDIRRIHNRHATNSQAGHNLASASGGVGASSGAIITGALDTTTALDLVLSGQLTNGSDTIILESYVVELFYRA